MFINRDNPKIYKRAIVYRVKFVSFSNSSFSIRNANYDYIADYEFLKLLEKTAGANWNLEELDKPDRRHKLIILLDILPTELMALLKVTNNILYAFEAYFNDNSLHKLAK